MPRLEALEDRTLPSTFLVTNLNDSGAGSLRAAVTAADAASGAVIDFAAGLHGTIKLTSGQLDLTSSMTINGPGASQITVSGNNASRVFDIGNNATATISGLTIANGSDTADEVTNFGGGGILNEAGSTLTLNRDVLKNNTATASNNTVDVFGGGLLNEGNATVVSCTFSGNQALGGGGGSFFGGSVGGAIDNFGGARLTVSHSTFTGNQALGSGAGNFGIGGAIENNAGLDGAHPSTATITGCVFTGNLASGAAGAFGNGGALDNEGPGATMSVCTSALVGNQSAGVSGGGGLGGGIMNFAGSTLTVTSTSFVGNQALGAGAGLNSEGLGGGIENTQASASVSGCLFTGDVAGGVAGVGGVSGFGGAVNNAGPGTSLTVSGSAFVGNQAVGGGGGAIDNADGATLTALNSSFVGNQTVGALVTPLGLEGGGAIDNFAAPVPGFPLTALSATATVSDCAFIGNTATGRAGEAGEGGALFNEGVGGASATLTVSDSTLIGNAAVGGAGAAASNGGAGVGGGIYDAGTLNLSGSSLLGNTALGGTGGAGANGGDGLGGGLAVAAGASATVSHSTITHNEALGGEEGAGGSDGQGIGGGVYSLGSFIDVATLIVNNHASTSHDNVFP